MRATLSKYQTRCHNGGGNREQTPYNVVNGRHSYGTKIYMTTDATRGRRSHQLRLQILMTLPYSHQRHTRRRQ
eukprot:7607508-Pyramimonas_sp.AAC.1